MKNKPPIKKGQIWASTKGDSQYEVVSKDGFKWKLRKLTNRPGVYHGTHTMTPYTIWGNYELIQD